MVSNARQNTISASCVRPCACGRSGQSVVLLAGVCADTPIPYKRLTENSTPGRTEASRYYKPLTLTATGHETLYHSGGICSSFVNF